MLRSLGVRLGYGAGTLVNTVEDVIAEARWAEAVGFDSFWLSQVFGVDPIVALAVAGSSAPGLAELGTSVVPLAGRHPLALGASARTAQSALAGRFTLGVGASHQMVTEGFFGEPYRRAFTRTREFLDALLPLLDGRTADVDGEQIFAKGWTNIEAEPCPVLLAALGPRMLELAGRLTDGTSLGSCGPRMIRDHVAPALREAADRAGRPSPRIVALVAVGVTSDVETLRRVGQERFVMYDAFPSYRRALDLEGVASGADLTVAGTPDDIVDGLRAYVDAGVTDLRLVIDAADDDDHHATREFLAEALRR